MDPVGYAILGLLAVTFLGVQRAESLRTQRIERKLNALLEKLGVSLYPAADKEVVALAQAGMKIEAIKRYREITGVNLKEAKDYVDQL